jgi:hypothetical protein
MVKTPTTTKEHVHQKTIDLNATTTNGADCETSRIMVHATRWLQGIEITTTTTRTSITKIAITLTTWKNQVPANPSGQEHREITINHPRIS